MSKRAVLLLFFIAFCLAEETTTNEPKIRTTPLSDSEILLTVTACTAAPVLGILLPTILYYKYCNKGNEVF